MPKYEITGLYTAPATIAAANEEDARKGYHFEHPGWAGTIFRVTEIEDDVAAD